MSALPANPPPASPPPAGTLREALAAGPVVLDGGLSNQLQAQGCDLSDALWSARLLADDPGGITAAHRAYVRAGAQVVTTASYQATYEGFARRGTAPAEATALLVRSVELARAAGARWVAASVGPYGAMLADGGEYRGRYGLSVRELARFHRPRLAVLAAAAPDVLALETVPDVDEAEALLRAAEGLGVPLWLSYTVADGRTRAGQPLTAAFELAAGNDQVLAVGVNCCAPQEVSEAVSAAVAATGKPVVAYPNSGESWHAPTRSWRGEAGYALHRAPGWYEAGARLIGGCCRVGPESITRLAADLAGD
ncbi:homocysteine S-methyltransferase [Streptomyces polyrhachis]|uniref:Homocysteine S-methyltransferase n=1 Tax=Streptomyces polyrhachis TaxID=1282885 RepID=A0ABW2GH61_9ACTN